MPTGYEPNNIIYTNGPLGVQRADDMDFNIGNIIQLKKIIIIIIISAYGCPLLNIGLSIGDSNRSPERSVRYHLRPMRPSDFHHYFFVL